MEGNLFFLLLLRNAYFSHQILAISPNLQIYKSLFISVSWFSFIMEIMTQCNLHHATDTTSAQWTPLTYMVLTEKIALRAAYFLLMDLWSFINSLYKLQIVRKFPANLALWLNLLNAGLAGVLDLYVKVNDFIHTSHHALNSKTLVV